MLQSINIYIYIFREREISSRLEYRSTKVRSLTYKTPLQLAHSFSHTFSVVFQPVAHTGCCIGYAHRFISSTDGGIL